MSTPSTSLISLFALPPFLTLCITNSIILPLVTTLLITVFLHSPSPPHYLPTFVCPSCFCPSTLPPPLSLFFPPSPSPYLSHLPSQILSASHSLTPPLSHLCALDLCNEARVLQLHPVSLIEFGANQKVEVLDLVIFSH